MSTTSSIARTITAAAAVGALLAGAAGCASRAAPATPPPDGDPAPRVAPAAVRDTAAGAAPTPGATTAPAAGTRRGYTEADVRFMQGMIGHHAQALRMTALVPSRTTRNDLRLLAERIEVSQRDEIRLMRRWLEDRREPAPDSGGSNGAAHAHHEGMAMPGMAADAPMPGMLTPADLAQLAATTGTAFDRLFLTDMIRHHEGALTMVARLLGAPGAAQEPQTFRFASDVDSDQRAEIARMRALLAKLPNDAPPTR